MKNEGKYSLRITGITTRDSVIVLSWRLAEYKNIGLFIPFAWHNSAVDKNDILFCAYTTLQSWY